MSLFERNVNGRLLRCGYTTGACAAAAAKAAATLLLFGSAPDAARISAPGGTLDIPIAQARAGDGFAVCTVIKDGGDDPDITNGMRVVCEVRRTADGVAIDGGAGVGRVTKPGLDQPVGAAAINSVPRKMIARAVMEVCEEFGYSGGMAVTVSIPGGEEAAKRTFNPRMGIEGGLSVIGTTGVVEPMSNKALVDTIQLEIRQKAADGMKALLLTPGNYGEVFARDRLMLSLRDHVSCSNFIGDAIDAAVESGVISILLVGHIGKLVKLGIGMMNTHSSNGDGRMETLIACALEAGAALPLLKAIAGSVTTDAALALLHDAGMLADAMRILGGRIGVALTRRVPGGVNIGYICFTNAEPFAGVLAESENAPALMKLWRE